MRVGGVRLCTAGGSESLLLLGLFDSTGVGLSPWSCGLGVGCGRIGGDEHDEDGDSRLISRPTTVKAELEEAEKRECVVLAGEMAAVGGAAWFPAARDN